MRANVNHLLRRFRRDESGATAIEYGLIATFIFLAIVTVVTMVGVNLQQPFQTANNGLN
jgi:pilus assembly protein Flp/PilA